MLNDHDWLLGKCEHEALSGPPTDSNGSNITYFKQQEPAFKFLRKILTDRAWLKSLDAYVKFRLKMYNVPRIYITSHRHTGMLESFHSLLLSYCPKRTAYGWVLSHP